MNDKDTTKTIHWVKYQNSRDEVRMERVWTIKFYLEKHGQLMVKINRDEIKRKAEEYEEKLPSG